MKPELKRLHSPDIDDLKNFFPSESDDFGFLLQIMVAPEGVDGEESFDVEVCTPKWLEKTHSQAPIISGRHLLIVREYNYHKILNFIKEYLSDCSGKDWLAVAEKISRLGKWEFEDYSD